MTGSSSHYAWRKEFRRKIAALALDPLWVNQVGEQIIQPVYFENEDEQQAVAAVYEYRNRYGRMPTDAEDVAELCTTDAAVEFVYDMFDRRHDDMTMPKDVAVQWAREQAVKVAILDSIQDIEHGDLASVLERVSVAVSLGNTLQSPGIDFVKDIDTWIDSIWSNKITTGWPHIDAVLDGGLGAGELGIIAAPTNRGKSVALINIAYGAAGLLSGKNVVIFTHEMSVHAYAKRIAARMMFRFPSRHGDIGKFEQELTVLAKRMLPGAIRIVGGAQRMGVHDIRNNVDLLIGEGFKPDIIIDDYADLIAPPRTYGERRFEISSVYEWLRNYAGELEIPIWTASQVGRQAYSKEVIRPDDIAEDIGKVNIADVMIALCQTDDEAAHDRGRLYMAKVRDGKRGDIFDSKIYLDSQAIVTIGKARYEDA